jgi:hypothetical protein
MEVNTGRSCPRQMGSVYRHSCLEKVSQSFNLQTTYTQPLSDSVADMPLVPTVADKIHKALPIRMCRQWHALLPVPSDFDLHPTFSMDLSDGAQFMSKPNLCELRFHLTVRQGLEIDTPRYLLALRA